MGTDEISGTTGMGLETGSPRAGLALQQTMGLGPQDLLWSLGPWELGWC